MRNKINYIKLLKVLAPNPFNKNINFYVGANTPEIANLTVYNLQGKLVSTQPLNLQAGINKINTTLDVEDGLYYLKLTTAQNIYTTQILKQ